MGLSDYFHRLADNRAPDGALDAALQTTLSVASPFYGVGAILNRLLHDTGLRERHSLPAIVLSVGNITLGGTGKTPFCQWLAAFLREEEKRPAILTRGYGRENENELLIVHNGTRLLAGTREAGDEPVLLARALGNVPVIASSNRARAGRTALKKFDVDTLILDDGFQHHGLQRQGDIVLIDSTRPLSTLRLLPRGTLREMPSVLSRAHLIVLTRWQQGSNPGRVLREVRSAAPSVPIVRTRLVISSASSLGTRAPVELESLRGKKAFLLCAVGNPDSVRRSAGEVGLQIVGSKILPDHARLSKALLLKCDSLRRRLRADYLVVTEKDAVKLAELGSLPPELIALRARIEMLTDRDRQIAETTIRARLHARTLRGYLN